MPAYIPPHRRRSTDRATEDDRPHTSSSSSAAALRCLCHLRPQLFPGGPHVLCSPCDSLLGSITQFCACFYHLEATPEAEQPELCLGRPAGCGADCAACPRKTVCLVARLLDHDGRAVHLGRYVNCFRGQGSDNVHAESFLTRDPALDGALHGLARGGTLEVYLTYQPCHNSGGHEPAAMGTFPSCTELLLGYHAAQLAPREVELRIKVAYVYRAHWRAGMCPPKYAPVVASARRGLQLLTARQGVRVTSFSAADWALLVGLCDEAVGAEYAKGDASAIFTPAVREARAAMDRFVQAVIEWCAAGATEPEVGVQRAGDPGDGLTAGLTRLQLSPKPGGEL